MPAQIKVVSMYTKVNNIQNAFVIDTTSKGGLWSGVSPFTLGPCDLYPDPQTGEMLTATNVENAWQYAKCYKQHTQNDLPTQDYWQWAKAGWANPRPIRYPMGRGARPQYSVWYSDGKQQLLSYVEARKAIYAPVYAKALKNGPCWETLQDIYQNESLIILRDYDGYDHAALGMTLTDVMNNPRKKMGHAFVMMMLLTNDPALKETTYTEVTP